MERDSRPLQLHHECRNESGPRFEWSNTLFTAIWLNITYFVQKYIQVWDIRIHFPVVAAATRVRGVSGATRVHRCVRVCACVCVCAAERH